MLRQGCVGRRSSIEEIIMLRNNIIWSFALEKLVLFRDELHQGLKLAGLCRWGHYGRQVLR